MFFWYLYTKRTKLRWNPYFGYAECVVAVNAADVTGVALSAVVKLSLPRGFAAVVVDVVAVCASDVLKCCCFLTLFAIKGLKYKIQRFTLVNALSFRFTFDKLDYIFF